MIDHIGIDVSDFEASKAFYGRALAPLAITLVVEVPASVTGTRAYAGMGNQDRAYFWFGGRARGTSEGPRPSPIHIAFTASNRQAVDAFYAAALNAGGLDNGAPGLRPQYHPNYYGAFVLDLDGNNIEAVCHTPPPS